MITARRAADFVAGIGVNVHLNALGPAASGEIAAALAYLGVDHVRTGANATMLAEGGLMARLATAGIAFDTVLPGRLAPADTVQALAAFAATHPGAVAAIEGPNEVDNFPFAYKSLTGAAAGLAFFADAIAAADAQPVLADVPVYDLTGVARSAALAADPAQFANIHPYPQLGRQPFDVLQRAISLHAIAGKGMVITEAGYRTGLPGGTWEAVDRTTQAKLTLNLVADAARLGVAATYLYDLSDDFDPTGIKPDANLGLFDRQLQPKPAATALHNLTKILRDPSPTAASFTPTPLDLALSGLPADGASLLLEKAGGVHELLVWAEPDIWNEATHTPRAAPLVPVAVDFAEAMDVRIFDPLVSDQPIDSYAATNHIVLAVRDHPLVVEIVAAGSGAVPIVAVPRVLTGNGGANTLIGDGGNDVLSGLAGNDNLWGGAGADRLIGGLGADQLHGGRGADTFVYRGIADSSFARMDTIFDFDAAEGDRIDLSAIDADRTRPGNQAFVLVQGDFTGHAGELVQVFTSTGSLLLGDSDGNGVADFGVSLPGVSSPLTPADLLL